MLVDTEIDTFNDKEPVKLEETVEQSSNELPEKYQGKSLDDIIKMHQEAEKLIGKQAQEVGEVRKLADELIKQNINKNQENIQQQEPEVDFFEDPKRAIQNTVDRHPDVLAAKQATQEFKKMQIQQKLSKDHPDYVDIVQNNDFVNWVKESPVRLGLYAKADGEFDYDSANELLSTYKALRSIKSKQVENDGKEVRKQSLKAASVDTGGSGESSRRVYRRADLIRLKMTDPQRYEALSDEIMKAYQEGRVK
jgi:hypothetical protein